MHVLHTHTRVCSYIIEHMHARVHATINPRILTYRHTCVHAHVRSAVPSCRVCFRYPERPCCSQAALTSEQKRVAARRAVTGVITLAVHLICGSLA